MIGAQPGRWRLQWQPLPGAPAWTAWPMLLAALAVVGLLLTFHQVVRGAVEQGESRRTASAALAVATWRCGTLPRAAVRENCLAALGVVPRGVETAAMAVGER